MFKYIVQIKKNVQNTQLTIYTLKLLKKLAFLNNSIGFTFILIKIVNNEFVINHYISKWNWAYICRKMVLKVSKITLYQARW